jgi:hypothetical protein
VVWDPSTGKHLVPSAWAHYRHVTLDQELEAGLLASLPEGTPVPFWLAMIRPVAVDFGQDLLDALELPGLDDQAAWGAVDAEMLDMAAAAHLTVGAHPWLLPLTYMRGSLARDLAARPLRPLPAHLGGAEVVGSELAHRNRQAQRGPTAVPFRQALQLPPDVTPPAPPDQAGERGSPAAADAEVDDVARQLASALRDSGFFEHHGLHPWVDGWSLVVAPTRRPEAWADSEFATLLRPALRPTGNGPAPGSPMTPGRPGGDGGT